MILVLSAIVFPTIDPVALQIGPLAIRWYALAYIGGLLVGWWYLIRLNRRLATPVLTREQIDDLVVWIILGVVFGGRIGYVLFYNAGYYLDNPAAILEVWRGGMSFHGGLLGVTVAIIWFSQRRRLPVLRVADLIACATPIGLFLGRIANFVNGELIGRPTDLPWGVIFPGAGLAPRHPSQLYEAGLEGVLLFAIMYGLFHRSRLATRPGALTGAFLIGYASLRSFGELFRQPDVQIGFLAGGVTMGQVLSLPLGLFGLYLLVRARPRQ